MDASGKRAVQLPAGRAWLNWWDLGAAPLPGDTTVLADVSADLTQTPLFLDACSLQAVVDPTVLTGLAVGADQKGADGFLLAAATESCTSAEFVRLDDAGEVSASWTRTGTTASLQVSAHAKPLQLVLRLPAEPKTVSVAGAQPPGMQWQPSKLLLYVQIPAGPGGAQLNLTW